MGDPAKKIESEALGLPAKNRAELARMLLLSLDGTGADLDEGVWADEADRRYREIREGSVEAIPSEDVFAEARSRRR